MDEETLAELTGTSMHSLILVFTDSTPGGSDDVLLQEDGSALLQEDTSNILL